jgi:hypothetical protein
MATLATPVYGFPYPDGAERVMDGDNAIGALALAVENRLLPSLRDLVPVMARATGPRILSSASEDTVPGMSIPPFAVGQSETALILASFDLNVTVAGVGAATGVVYVNGSSRGGGSVYAPATTGRASILSATLAALAPGGSPYTIEGRVHKSAGAGTATCESASTSVGNVSQSYLVLLRFKVGATLLELLDAADMDVGAVKPADLERLGLG